MAEETPTLTDDEIVTNVDGVHALADTGDDSGDVADTGDDSGDDSGDVSDTGDTGDVSDTGDDASTAA